MTTQIRAFQIHASVFGAVGATFIAQAAINLDQGRFVRASGAGIVNYSDKSSESLARAIGATVAAILSGNSGAIQFGSTMLIEFDLGLALTEGDAVFVSTSGMGTNLPSSTVGEANTRAGHVLDASGYSPGGPSPQYALIEIEIDQPVEIL